MENLDPLMRQLFPFAVGLALLGARLAIPRLQIAAILVIEP